MEKGRGNVLKGIIGASTTLKDAIRSVGRAKDPAAAKRWIKKRAKELGKESLLPEDWE